MQLPDLPNEAHWFDDSLAVQRRGDTDPVVAVLGKKFSDLALVHLCGAPQGSTVVCDVQGWPFDKPDALQEPAIVITASNTEFFGPGVDNLFVVHQDETTKKLELYIEFMSLRNSWAGHGLATMMFWRMARACLSLKIERVALYAMGGRTDKPVSVGGEMRRWTGYDFWPTIGFDGDIPASAKSFIDSSFPFYPTAVAEQKRVRDYLELPDGRALWKLCGAPVSECVFEMTPDSDSMLALAKRVKRLFGVDNV